MKRVEMLTETQSASGPRRAFMVLSPRALHYATYALESLFRNVLESLHLYLITDTAEDRQVLEQEAGRLARPGSIQYSVFGKDDLEERESEYFAKLPHLRSFRNGHPCWRKITDPVLLSRSGEEMVLLDPDLLFPNRFAFEETPDRELLLMWQRPNCLFPPETVAGALQEGIPLANHVDIGVAHWRAPVDLEWLEWLIGKLGGANLPRVMHIEAIVWAAVAMRIGGGYLPPLHWRCWKRSQWKRVLRRLGLPGVELLRIEPFTAIKCFHAGGEAKSWLPEAARRGWTEGGREIHFPAPILPFIELTKEQFHREQRMKNLLHRLGYYQIFQSA